MTALPFALAVLLATAQGSANGISKSGSTETPTPTPHPTPTSTSSESSTAAHPERRAVGPESRGTPTSPASPTPAVPHRPGERMELDVSLGFFKAGEARISVGQREGELLPVFLESRTTGLIGLVKLRQHLVSNLDTGSGLPRSSRLEGVEPGYRHVDTAIFDRGEGIATVREVGKYDNTYRVEVPEGTLDFVALVFQLRTLPLLDGEQREFHVLAGRKVSKVIVSVEGRETVKTPAGEFAAIKVRVPTGLTGKFSEKSPTYLWFSDDARRAVVRISADFSVGRANALLTAYTPGAEPVPAAH